MSVVHRSRAADSRKTGSDQPNLIAMPRTPDGRTLEHPAWADLDAAGRETAFEEALVMRVLEAALDPDGYSTTVRAVAAAIAGR